MDRFSEIEQAILVALTIVLAVFLAWSIASEPEVICDQGICIEE